MSGANKNLAVVSADRMAEAQARADAARAEFRAAAMAEGIARAEHSFRHQLIAWAAVAFVAGGCAGALVMSLFAQSMVMASGAVITRVIATETPAQRAAAQPLNVHIPAGEGDFFPPRTDGDATHGHEPASAPRAH